MRASSPFFSFLPRILFGILGLVPLAWAQGFTIQQVDVSTSGVQGSGWCTSIHVSDDGRFVAFNTSSNNLVPGDTNGAPDGFLRDLVTGSTELPCVGVSGQHAMSETVIRGLSHDGRFVVFVSAAPGLHPGDTDGFADVFVRDRLLGTTELISVLMDSTPSIGHCLRASISADGRYVAFEGDDPNFVPGDTNGVPDVFVRDRLLGTTTLVSIADDGSLGDSGSGWPSISADGQRIVFRGSASNFHPSFNYAVTGAYWHAYLRDLAAGKTIAIDLNPWGRLGDGGVSEIAISADGSTVVFQSSATDLLPDGPFPPDNFLARGHIWREGQPMTALQYADGRPGAEVVDASPSMDGRYVAFKSTPPYWVAGDPTGQADIFLQDTVLHVTHQISANGYGEPANHYSYRCSMSDDGRVVAFLSQASNLVPGTIPGPTRAFVRIADPTPGFAYCWPSKESPAGCLPAFSAQGASSASAGAGHTIEVAGTLNAEIGLLVYSSVASDNVPFGSGFLCVGSPLVRLGAQATGGAPPPTVDCSGALALDFNAWIAGGQDGALVPGAAVYLQSWTRDPTSPTGALLSDALAFLIGP
jgi:Tol biopolymer transport system component